MTVQNVKKYDEKQIRVLKGLAPVRKRPGMYIGNTSSQGLHHLVWEVVDNSIDEALAGRCDTIQVMVNADQSITVIDNGSGIPVGIHPEEGRSTVEIVMTYLHAGGKFDDQGYKFSGGLHGVGVSVVNALSEWLVVEVKREGKIHTQKYVRGVPVSDLEVVGVTNETGTKVSFKPDPEIFQETTEFDYSILRNRLQELAFLNRGIKIILEDQREGKEQSEEFQFDGGIRSFVEYLNRNREVLHSPPIYIEGTKESMLIEAALQYNDSFSARILSFANNIHTHEGERTSRFKSALSA